MNRMDAKTVIALKNYDWMVRNHGLEDVELAWDSATVIYGDGGAHVDQLEIQGFTPATWLSDANRASQPARPILVPSCAVSIQTH
jgi:hypothetical protein